MAARARAAAPEGAGSPVLEAGVLQHPALPGGRTGDVRLGIQVASAGDIGGGVGSRVVHNPDAHATAELQWMRSSGGASGVRLEVRESKAATTHESRAMIGFRPVGPGGLWVCRIGPGGRGEDWSRSTARHSTPAPAAGARLEQAVQTHAVLERGASTWDRSEGGATRALLLLQSEVREVVPARSEGQRSGPPWGGRVVAVLLLLLLVLYRGRSGVKRLEIRGSGNGSVARPERRRHNVIAAVLRVQVLGVVATGALLRGAAAGAIWDAQASEVEGWWGWGSAGASREGFRVALLRRPVPSESHGSQIPIPVHPSASSA